MKVFKKIKKNLVLISNPRLVFQRTKYIFLFSHMRSRSSVLSHILGSNPDICGYYELQQRYLVYRHVIAMRRVLHKELKCSLKDKYLFDKILHNRLRVSKKILKKMNPKIIFLLREPVATLKSMINLMMKY